MTQYNQAKNNQTKNNQTKSENSIPFVQRLEQALALGFNYMSYLTNKDCNWIMLEIMYAKIPKLIDLYRNVLKLDRNETSAKSIKTNVAVFTCIKTNQKPEYEWRRFAPPLVFWFYILTIMKAIKTDCVVGTIHELPLLRNSPNYSLTMP